MAHMFVVLLHCRFAHEGILNSARAVQQHLKQHGILDKLLLGTGSSHPGQHHKLLPDCRGWHLVVTGHSLGKQLVTDTVKHVLRFQQHFQ